MQVKQSLQQEPFSFQSCQVDDFFDPFYLSFFEPQKYDEASVFMNELEDSVLLDQNARTQSELIESFEVSSTEDHSKTMDVEKSTAKSSESSVCHYKNIRRKKHERILIEKLQSRFSSLNQQDKNSDSKKTAKLTKNILAFGKNSHMEFIILMYGNTFIEERPWLNMIYNKEGMNLEDYDKLYKCEELRPIFRLFFQKKVIYRDLMTSRTTPVNKIFYLYYMKVFERNFRKRSFKGISETMLEIEREKKGKKYL